MRIFDVTVILQVQVFVEWEIMSSMRILGVTVILQVQIFVEWEIRVEIQVFKRLLHTHQLKLE